MACSMIKKGVLGAALGAGALYAAFGTSAPDYVRVGLHKFRHNVKRAVPVQTEIDMARDQVARLEPALRDNIENWARASVEVEHLDREVAQIRTNLDAEKKQLIALRSYAGSGDVKLAGNSTYTAEEVKADLTRRYDHYTQVEQILQSKEDTLKVRREGVKAAEKQLEQMKATKQALLTKLAAVESRLKMIQTTQESNEFNFDDSALSRAKASVADLEKRLDVMSRAAEMEGKFAGPSIPVLDQPARDVTREIDAKFGAPANGQQPAHGEKSL